MSQPTNDNEPRDAGALSRGDLARLVRFETMLEQTLASVNRLVAIVEGDGRTGLLARQARIEGELLDLQTRASRLDRLLFGTESDGKTGLVSRIVETERVVEALARLTKAVVLPVALSIILGALAFVWALVTHNIEIVTK